MPTSTTDAAKRRRDERPHNAAAMRVANATGMHSDGCSRRAHRRSGFTLLELLVVIVIIGLLASLVSVNLLPDARQGLREEAMRLAALLGHAREEAIATGVTVAWQRIDGGYRFLQRAPDRTWRPVDADMSLRPRALPGGVILIAIDGPASAKDPQPLIVLSPTGVAEPFRITLALGEHRVRVTSDGVNAPLVEDSAR